MDLNDNKLIHNFDQNFGLKNFIHCDLFDVAMFCLSQL